MKKLYRSKDNRVFAGVIGGLGEYLDIDPVLLRTLFVLLTIFTGIIPGTIVYLFTLFIVPRRQRGYSDDEEKHYEHKEEHKHSKHYKDGKHNKYNKYHKHNKKSRD